MLGINSSGISLFTIELDRSNGIYHGGEVVSGKVRLDTTKDITTRSARLRFQGVGYMYFSSGSGDDRTDYYGTKVFQEDRRTFFGNYFMTPAIDDAGADAKFCDADGDGILYIPCNQDEKLSLVVRVMNKSDTVLGEILLDTNTLIARRKPTSFSLTRNGAPEKGEITLSAKLVTSETPFQSGSIHQIRTCNMVCQLRVHQATGLRKGYVTRNNDVYIQAYRALDVTEPLKALPEPDVRAVLPAGTLEFPFAFTLRADAPGSAELGVGEKSYIRYSLYGYIDNMHWSNPSVRQVITVLASRPLPSPPLLRSIEYKCDQPMPLSSCCCFPCFNIGDVTIDVKLGRQAFACGEKLDFHLRVANNTTEVLDVKIGLSCSILLQVHHEHSAKRKYDIKRPVYDDTVEPNAVFEIGYDSANCTDPTGLLLSSANNSKSKSTSVLLPTVYPSFNGAYGHSTAVREPVTFAYSVVFKVSAPGRCGTSHSVTFPVVICAAPPSTAALQAARTNNALHTIRQVTPDGGSPFALTYNMDYVPEETEENVLATEVVPVGSPVSTFMPEDARAVVHNQKYQSYARTYASSTNSITNTVLEPVNDEGIHLGKGSMYDRVAGGYAAVAPAPFSSFNVDTHISTVADPGAALIASLRGSANLRATVRAWATSTDATVVRTMSPDSLQRVLQSIDFSTDQVAVAHELAQLIHCTCAHVVAALAVNSFYKTEMATRMAPFARDTENRSKVLDLLPMYDQKKVEALFVNTKRNPELVNMY